MDALWDGLVEALRLVAERDPILREIALRTVFVSGTATLIATVAGVPIAYGIAHGSFRGRTVLLSLVNTGMGFPPTVVGLVVWVLLVRSGPLGDLELVYTKRGMIAAQAVIGLPLVVGFGTAAFQSVPAELGDLLRVLGAGRLRSIWLLAREARLGLLAAVIAGFGAAISEVGASIIVGGNLQGSTRVLTTAIVTETSRGQNAAALAYGIVLLAITFTVAALLTVLQQRDARR